uniref:Proline-rich protein PRCC n=1 Tax=Plectus sambesii TaxID=2011161 RepID=A0A914VC52_9BILA
MNSLVGYGSDSDEGSDTEQQPEDEQEELAASSKVLVGLPTRKTGTSQARSGTGEDTLDETVKRHDWELKEAPKPPSIAKKRPKGPAKIAAFGSLTQVDEESEESDDDDAGAVKRQKVVGQSGLLAMLPKPKTAVEKPGKAPSILLPNSVRLKQQSKREQSTSSGGVSNAAIPRSGGDDSDQDDDDRDEQGDFFGLSRKHIADEIEMPISAFGMDAQYGPARPPPGAAHSSRYSAYETDDSEEPQHASQMYNMAGVEVSAEMTAGQISDEAARKLIFRHEMAPWGFHESAATSAVSDIIDVSVDQSLGPNIRANLLKNLSDKPLQLPQKPQKKVKETQDVNAKRKHQITYLARVAVDREDELQKQWAQNKHNKRMAAQKYGF